jgi:hypothetical protein
MSKALKAQDIYKVWDNGRQTWASSYNGTSMWLQRRYAQELVDRWGHRNLTVHRFRLTEILEETSE